MEIFLEKEEVAIPPLRQAQGFPCHKLLSMKKIKAYNLGYDFQNIDIRRLSGYLEDARRQWKLGIEQVNLALEKLEEFKETERDSEGMTRFTLDDILKNATIRDIFSTLEYIHHRVPDFGIYFRQ